MGGTKEVLEMDQLLKPSKDNTAKLRDDELVVEGHCHVSFVLFPPSVLSPFVDVTAEWIHIRDAEIVNECFVCLCHKKDHLGE